MRSGLPGHDRFIHSKVSWTSVGLSWTASFALSIQRLDAVGEIGCISVAFGADFAHKEAVMSWNHTKSTPSDGLSGSLPGL